MGSIIGYKGNCELNELFPVNRFIWTSWIFLCGWFDRMIAFSHDWDGPKSQILAIFGLVSILWRTLLPLWPDFDGWLVSTEIISLPCDHLLGAKVTFRSKPWWLNSTLGNSIWRFFIATNTHYGVLFRTDRLEVPWTSLHHWFNLAFDGTWLPLR